MTAIALALAAPSVPGNEVKVPSEVELRRATADHSCALEGGQRAVKASERIGCSGYKWFIGDPGRGYSMRDPNRWDHG